MHVLYMYLLLLDEPQKSKIYTFAEQVTRVDSSPVKGTMTSTSFDDTRHENSKIFVIYDQLMNFLY